MRKQLGFLLVLSALAPAAAIEQPSMVSMNVPKYPPLARVASIQGSVVLKVSIDEHGAVSNVTEVSGHPMLKVEATANVKTWKFNASGEGRPVEIVVTYRYILDGGVPDRPFPSFRVEGPTSVEVHSTPPVVSDVVRSQSRCGPKDLWIGWQRR